MYVNHKKNPVINNAHADWEVLSMQKRSLRGYFALFASFYFFLQNCHLSFPCAVKIADSYIGIYQILVVCVCAHMHGPAFTCICGKCIVIRGLSKSTSSKIMKVFKKQSLNACLQ